MLTEKLAFVCVGSQLFGRNIENYVIQKSIDIREVDIKSY